MRAAQACSAFAPAARASQAVRMSSGTTNGSYGQSMCLRVAATSASPSAAPCVASVPCLFGEPQPMTVLQQMSDGRSASAVAAWIARSIAAASCPSTSRTTCQP